MNPAAAPTVVVLDPRLILLMAGGTAVQIELIYWFVRVRRAHLARKGMKPGPIPDAGHRAIFWGGIAVALAVLWLPIYLGRIAWWVGLKSWWLGSAARWRAFWAKRAAAKPAKQQRALMAQAEAVVAAGTNPAAVLAAGGLRQRAARALAGKPLVSPTIPTPAQAPPQTQGGAAETYQHQASGARTQPLREEAFNVYDRDLNCYYSDAFEFTDADRQRLAEIDAQQGAA